jgi:hypothetical protein
MLTPALRVEASLHRLGCLRAEIFDWTQRRQKLDKRNQYVTQLASLRATLDSALERLSAKACGFAPRSAAEAYDLCREFDDRLLVVRRLWRWFADKFDQRDVDQFAKTLSAADEVVWSIHAGIMRAVHDGDVPAPAPLPYFDELGAPEAVPRDEPPRDLRLTDYDEALQLILARLPIPVIGLGADTWEAPWELALLGHEVGHHLQYDLLPGRQLVESVGKAVASAAGGGETGAQWRWWSRELFADLSGLVTIGPSSLTALLPLEFGAERHMLDRERGRYPAPVVRLKVIAAMAGKLGLDVADALRGTASNGQAPLGDAAPAQASALIRADLDQAPKVAAALVDCTVSGNDTLATLSGFSAREFALDGAIWQQADQLMRNDEVVDTGIRAARDLASAGVVAWQRLITIADRTERDRRLAMLGAILVDSIIASAEEETRAVETTISEVSVGFEVADILTRGLES